MTKVNMPSPFTPEQEARIIAIVADTVGDAYATWRADPTGVRVPEILKTIAQQAAQGVMCCGPRVAAADAANPPAASKPEVGAAPPAYRIIDADGRTRDATPTEKAMTDAFIEACRRHDARVTELLEANDREVERRREAERRITAALNRIEKHSGYIPNYTLLFVEQILRGSRR